MSGLSGLSGLSSIFAQIPPFVPTDVSGLVAWWKADAITGLNDGDALASGWVDSSGFSQTLTEATGANRPLYKTNVQNTLPAVRFDGTNDKLKTNLAVALSQPVTIFWTAQLDADAAADGTDHVSVGSDDSTNLMLMYKHGSSKRWYSLSNTALPGSAVDSTWHVFSAKLNGASSEIFIDGVSMAYGDVGTKNPDGIVLGALWTGATFWKGDIGEVLIYDPSLSAYDHRRVEQYLMRRWDENAGGQTFNVTAGSLHDNGYTNDATAYLRSSPFARWRFNSSAEFLRLNTYNTIYTTFAAYAEVTVNVNGAYYATLASSALNAATLETALPAGDKVVELVAGLQTMPVATILGTFIRSAYFGPGTTTEIAPTTPANRVLVYGDSIAVGANAATPAKEAWPILLRADVPVAVEAWGYRSLYDDANTGGLRAALVAQLASFAPATIWIAIGTNDYGLNKWSAASFGTAYAALLDDLHTALPSAAIYCQTPITRGTETANGSGSTLGNYRAQITAAVSTRTAYATLIDGTAWTIALDVDALHPTTAGHAAYYAEVKADLGV